MEKQDLQMNDNITIWHKFYRNRFALAGLIFVGLVSLFAILGYLVVPDDSPMANRQVVEIAAKKPGFSVYFLKKPLNMNVVRVSFFKRMLFGQPSAFEYIPISAFYFQEKNLIIQKYSNIPGEAYSEKYPLEIFMKNNNSNIENTRKQVLANNIERVKFILGTDRYGRDMLSRLLIGARVSLSVGFIAVLISLIIGLMLGLLAGYYKGWIDSIIMWIVNVNWSVPTMLLAISISLVLGKGFWQVFMAIGLTMWVEVARVVRGQVLSIREKDYVEACRAMGFSNIRILIRHILPNTMGSVIIISTANFISAILLESSLSFLGIGVQPPIPSWGNMIKDHYGYIILDKAYLAVFPGLFIMLLVLAFIFIGNGLRDAFDSKSNITF